jgi:TP901 family phage tail tape measure protein
VSDLKIAIILTLENRAKGAMRGVGDEAQRAGKKIRSSLNVAADLNQAANAVSRLSGMARGALAAPITAVRDYGKGIAEVTTLVDESAFSQAEIEKIVQGSAATYGDLKGQASALYQSISAGATTATQAQDVLNTANRLAVGGVTDTTTAVDGLTTVLNAYGSSAGSSTDAADTFFVAVREGKTTVGELSQNIGTVAPIAATLGITFDETAAALATMTKQGINTANASTALNATMVELLKPSKAMRAEAKRLGVDISRAAIEEKGLAGVLDGVTSSAKFNQKSMGRLFSNVRALKGALALTANDGEIFSDTLEAMGGKAGAAGVAFDKMAGSVDFRLKQLDAQKDLVLVELGDALVPILEEMVPVLREWAGIVQSLAKSNPDLVRSMAKMLGVVVVAGPPVAALALAISSVNTIAKLTRLTMIPLGKGIEAVNKGFAATEASSSTAVKGAGRVAAGVGILSAALVGFQFGTALDKMFGISDKLSGVTHKRGARGAPVTQESLNDEEKLRRRALVEEVEAARVKQDTNSTSFGVRKFNPNVVRREIRFAEDKLHRFDAEAKARVVKATAEANTEGALGEDERISARQSVVERAQAAGGISNVGGTIRLIMPPGVKAETIEQSGPVDIATENGPEAI